MASFRTYRGRWTATARVPDTYTGTVAAGTISQTFRTKREARLWAEATESAMRLGTWKDPRLEPRKTGRWEDRPLADTLRRYRETVTPTKKGALQEATLMERWERHELAARPMRSISRADIAAYRDARIAAGKAPSTIRNEVHTLSAVFAHAAADWEYDIENPVRALRQRKGSLPRARPGRDRRLVEGEQIRIEDALAAGLDGHLMLPLWKLLLDTGMRLGEALSLDVGSCRRGDRSLILEDTKNGDTREVLLSDTAWTMLLTHVKGLDDVEPLFGDLDIHSVEYRYRLACAQAKVSNLRLHDLRHEALSRMAARGVDLKTMMLQSGHKTPAMLLRYLNPTIEERRAKLFGDTSPKFQPLAKVDVDIIPVI